MMMMMMVMMMMVMVMMVMMVMMRCLSSGQSPGIGGKKYISLYDYISIYQLYIYNILIYIYIISS